MIISEVEKIIAILLQDSKNSRPFDLKFCYFTPEIHMKAFLGQTHRNLGLIQDAVHHICILPCVLDRIIESFMLEKPFKIIKSNH